MNSEENRVLNNEVLLEAIQKLDAKIDNLNSEMDKKFQKVDNRLEEMRLEMMSFDVRIDRLEATSHKMLDIAINTRADVKVLREEVRAWSKDVSDLQLKTA